MKRYLRKLMVMMAVVCMLCSFTGCSHTIKLDAPTNITSAYDGNGNAIVSWDNVENASGYDIYMDGGYLDTIEDSNCEITNVEEGKTHSIEVMAIAFNKKEEKFTSEPAQSNLDIPVMLDNLKLINIKQDGSFLYLYWDKVKGATSYEMKISEDGEAEQFDENARYISNMQDGQQLSIYIRTVRNVGTYIYYGDWGRYDISFPAYEYSSLGFESAICLDIDRLKLWAKKRGYSVRIIEEDGVTFADVHYEDKNNSGFTKGLGRLVNSVIEGFLTGAVDSAGQTYNSDFADISSTIEAFSKSGGVKGYASEKKEELKNAGTAGAFVYGLNSLLTDSDIHYVYRYVDTKKAATLCESYMFYSHNESYLQNRYKDLEKSSDGLYHYITSTNVPVCVYAGVNYIDNFKYNVTIVGYDD